MAIFYNYIKGVANANTTTKVWSYLKWNDNSAPELLVHSANVHNIGEAGCAATSIGKLIIAGDSAATTITEQTIYSKLKIANDLYIPSLSEYTTGNGINIKNKIYNSTNWSILADGTATFKTTSITNTLSVTQLATFTNGIKTSSYQNSSGTELIDSSNNIKNITSITASGMIKSTGASIQGLYFNATSDIRAKEDIKDFNIDALDIIKKVQLHTYQYKDTKQKSLGVIAQDLIDIDINGVKLIDNENASGIDGDYIGVKESKLVYVLWKAIQELQTEVEDLKSQLRGN